MEKLELELIEAYLDEDYHNEALMLKATSQNRRLDLLKDISDIDINHIIDGHLSQENYNKRYEIEKEL